MSDKWKDMAGMDEEEIYGELAADVALLFGKAEYQRGWNEGYKAAKLEAP